MDFILLKLESFKKEALEVLEELGEKIKK